MVYTPVIICFNDEKIKDYIYNGKCFRERQSFKIVQREITVDTQSLVSFVIHANLADFFVC